MKSSKAGKIESWKAGKLDAQSLKLETQSSKLKARNSKLKAQS
jgi:hypothetical protein